MTAPTIGSLCTGYGGLDMAVEQVLSGELAWAADNDPSVAKLLSLRHPFVPNHGDITTVAWENVPSVDIVTAGFPCQPVSAAGRKKGVEDARWIWPHCARAIRVLQPRIAFVENVGGLRTRGFDVVATDLADAGYDLRWCSIRASAAGAPHRRLRMFILAIAADAHREPWLQRGQSVASETSCWWAYAEPERRAGALAAAHPEGIRLHRPLPPWDRGPGPAHSSCPAADTSGQRRDQRQPEPTRFEGRYDVAGDGSAAWGEYAQTITRWQALTGRAAPAPTAPTGRSGAERLASVAVEFLMGLEAGHVTGLDLSRTAELRILGNGVVPQQAVIALIHLLSLDPEALT